MTAGVDDVRSDRANLAGTAFADRDHRAGAVTEQSTADPARDLGLQRREGQRAQFHRQQDRDIIGRSAQIVVQSRHACRTSHAAEAEHRHPPHIGPHTEPGGHPCLQRGHHDPGHRRRDDQVNIAGP